MCLFICPGQPWPLCCCVTCWSALAPLWPRSSAGFVCEQRRLPAGGGAAAAGSSSLSVPQCSLSLPGAQQRTSPLRFSPPTAEQREDKTQCWGETNKLGLFLYSLLWAWVLSVVWIFVCVVCVYSVSSESSGSEHKLNWFSLCVFFFFFPFLANKHKRIMLFMDLMWR